MSPGSWVQYSSATWSGAERGSPVRPTAKYDEVCTKRSTPCSWASVRKLSTARWFTAS